MPPICNHYYERNLSMAPPSRRSESLNPRHAVEIRVVACKRRNTELLHHRYDQRVTAKQAVLLANNSRL